MFKPSRIACEQLLWDNRQEHLFTSLAQKCCRLTELDVSWCYYVTDDSIKLFLSSKCKLKLLRIKSCNRVSSYMAMCAYYNDCKQVSSSHPSQLRM